MGEPPRLPPAGLDDLKVEDQIDDVQALWDRIAAHSDRVPLPDWPRQLIDERLAAHAEDPSLGVPWEQVRDELDAKVRPVSRPTGPGPLR